MMKKYLTILSLAACCAAGPLLSAQSGSRTFRLGQWMEIHGSILRELNRSYVDTLPLGRMMSGSIDAMLKDLDPYTEYVPESEEDDFEMRLNKTYGGVGAIIYKPDTQGNVIINEPYAHSPAADAGLRCADEIIAIDGVSTHGLTTQQSSEKMRGQPGTKVVLRVVKAHGGDTVDIEIKRRKIHLPDIEYAGMLDKETGYILQSQFTSGVADEFRAAFLRLKKQGMKRLVIDLRGNGGGLLNEAVGIVSLFVPKGSLVVSSRGRTEDSNREYRTTSAPADTKIPLIVLVDGGTASSAEIVSGALQDMDRATIMGRRTFGKGLVQSVRPVAYNGQLKVTSAKYYTPSGRCVQAIDYAKRDEKGSVQHIPDSLTHEFRTARGRIVRDGGGITPDRILPQKEYSRVVYAVVLGSVADNYAIEYARRHVSIPEPEQFHLSDADFEDFVRFAQTQTFDYRSQSKALFDQMKEELEKDGQKERLAPQLEALEKAIVTDKREVLMMAKDQLIPFLEEEIAVRYYFQEAGVKIRLRYDSVLEEALKQPLI